MTYSDVKLTPMPNLPLVRPGQGEGLDFHPCAGGSQAHEHLPPHAGENSQNEAILIEDASAGVYFFA